VSAGASLGQSPPFGWLKPAPPPSAWKELTSASGGTVLWYAPSFKPAESDPNSVSAAVIRGGTYFAYLNAGPPTGGEELGSWPSFRLAHLTDEGDSSVREEGQASGLTFRGSHGTCVIDDYVTRVKAHHYREIACFAQGAKTASVLVAAALESSWATYAPELEGAIDAWQVR
jgi:hypothetical protein